MIDIDNVFSVIVPEDDSQIPDSNASVARPLSGHMDKTWVSARIFGQTRQGDPHPFPF